MLCVFQLKYKQSLKKDASSLFHLMPETNDTMFHKQQTEMLSEVPQSGIIYIGFNKTQRCRCISICHDPAATALCINQHLVPLSFFKSRWSIKKRGRKRWTSTCTLCCLTPSTRSTLKSRRTCRARCVQCRLTQELPAELISFKNFSFFNHTHSLYFFTFTLPKV